LIEADPDPAMQPIYSRQIKRRLSLIARLTSPSQFSVALVYHEPDPSGTRD
jgi:hypothetical protein